MFNSYITRGVAAALGESDGGQIPYTGEVSLPPCCHCTSAKPDQSQKEPHGCGVPSGL